MEAYGNPGGASYRKGECVDKWDSVDPALVKPGDYVAVPYGTYEKVVDVRYYRTKVVITFENTAQMTVTRDRKVKVLNHG